MPFRFPAVLRACPALLVAMIAGATGPEGATWMKGLPDTAPVSALSIPGTHDSGALHEPLPGVAKCQSLTLAQQLDAGVRFLDIRCRHRNDAFEIYHGPVSQNLTFDAALATVRDFLRAHPSETVILSVKEESSPAGNTRSFERTFDAAVTKDAGAWFLGDTVPTLGAVRGKIILFRRFPATTTPRGLPASRWPDNTTFDAGFLRVQDRYDLSDVSEKWRHIESLLNRATKDGPDGLFVNFSSATGGRLGLPDTPAMARPVNARLSGWLAKNPHGRYGIVVMDFADASLCSLVYRSNFPAGETR